MATVFQTLASGPSGPGGQAKKYAVEFRAGKMVRDGNMVRPDTRRGLVFMEVSEDSLVHFCWKDRKSNNIEDDLIIFPEEAEFIKVQQSKDRVFMLAFKSSSQKHFFWMQEPSSEKDSELMAKVNAAINDPSSLSSSSNSQPAGIGGAGGAAQSLQEQLVRMLQQGQMGANFGDPALHTSSVPTTATAQPTPTGRDQARVNPSEAGAQRIRNILEGYMREQQQTVDVDLSRVLSHEALRPILNDSKAREALFPHLPHGVQPTPGELDETIRSPQFERAVHLLARAIRSGHLDAILSSLGLDPSSTGGAQGVEGFLRAIRDATKPKDGGRSNPPGGSSNDQGDSMDTS